MLTETPGQRCSKPINNTGRTQDNLCELTVVIIIIIITFSSDIPVPERLQYVMSQQVNHIEYTQACLRVR